MLYNTCYITFAELLYNIQIWLYNIQDGYITHPNLPDAYMHLYMHIYCIYLHISVYIFMHIFALFCIFVHITHI